MKIALLAVAALLIFISIFLNAIQATNLLLLAMALVYVGSETISELTKDHEKAE